MAGPARGLLAAVRRLTGPAPDPDSDAALLARYVADRNGDAFAALVRRHGPMVRAVCRRELGPSADADDAFQATFFVLARDARKVRGESLAGWLYRVAHRVSRKLIGRLHRHPTAALGPDDAMTPTTPSDAAETREARTAVGDELAALPDKFRAVLVLCSLEGRTNAEAAAVLGCPVGTVDSRLSAAKAKLKDRLVRRGLAPTVATAAVTGLADPLARAGSVGLEFLYETTVSAALDYAAAGNLTDPISTLADGVTHVMNAKLKLLVAAGLAAGILGTTGAGLYYAGDGGSQKNPDAKVPADPPKNQPPSKAAVVTVSVNGESRQKAQTPGTTAETTAILSLDAGFKDPIDMTLVDLFDYLSQRYGTTFRAEQAWFKQQGIEIYEQKVSIRITRGLSVQDILNEVAVGLSIEAGKVGFHVKGNQIILGPAFVPASIPGSFRTGETVQTISISDIQKMLYGPTVSIAVKDKSLTEIVDLLCEQTGANIVLHCPEDQIADPRLTLTLNDVKLFTVLKVVGNMCDLAPAVVDNVFYLTDPAKAEKLQRETEKNLFGEPPASVPAGYVTDGVNLYLRPANLKPVEGIGGGMGRFVPAKPEPSKPEPPKPTPKEKKQ